MNIQAALKQIIRLGKVTAIFDETGYVQVTFFDREEEPREIPMFSFISEYNMPEMGDTVLCLFLPFTPSGFCLGKWFSETNKPPANNRNIWFKSLRKKGAISFDDRTETLTINVKKIVINSEEILQNGKITSTGDIKAGAISLTLHIHGNGNNGADTTAPKA